jgi:hypothetical protein
MVATDTQEPAGAKLTETRAAGLPQAAAPAVPAPAPAGEAAPVPDLAALQRYAAERALRLTLKDLDDPIVQRKVACARLVEGAPWKLKEATRDALARQHGVSPATIRRWCAEVASWRARARVPQISLLDTSLPLPTSRSFQPEAVAAGLACYADNLKRGAKGAYEALVALAQAKGWRIGDYSSYTRLVKQVPSPVWDYLKKGATGFELATAPKILRAWLATPAYSVLCGDQNIPDYQVVEPSTGEIYTPELYLWMDCTSRAWVGLWPAFGHYSRYTIGAALREACRLATPDEIFTDWGKPETSHYTAQILAGLRGFCGCGDWSAYGARFGALDGPGLDDGPAHRKTSRVGIPWQKPIENQMNVLKRQLLARDTPGFRQRQAGAWENDQLQEELKRARRDGQLLTTEQFWERLRDIATQHNQSACRVQETPTPIVPAEVLGRGLASQGRTVFDDLTLDLIFLPRVTRAINHSLVRVQVAPGDLRRFYAPELSRLGPKERVQVSYDPFDADKPAVITHPDGSYLCLAEPWTVQQPGDAAGLADKIQRQMALMRWWRQQIAAIRAPLLAAGASAVPRIGGATQVAKLADRADRAKPDAGAAKRADQALLERFGLAG